MQNYNNEPFSHKELCAIAQKMGSGEEIHQEERQKIIWQLGRVAGLQRIEEEYNREQQRSTAEKLRRIAQSLED